ncbi:MAG TPA: DUF4331 family protein [Thermoanaerobaculia bacterium]|nr:DUF4331 family protein [Thermoanaerobaculia bacterium]
MGLPPRTFKPLLLLLPLSGWLLTPAVCLGSDHNDPNAVNAIFSDINVSAADLYDLFGFPGEDTTGGERVVIALTFASIPKTGVFDTDMLYRIRLNADPRVTAPARGDQSLDAWLRYAEAVKAKYLNLKAAEIRVTVDASSRAHVAFIDFPGGSFSRTVDANKNVTIDTPDGHSIKIFVGGRDDPFFNDLPGFFRSINYAPQFYHVPHTMPDKRELQIPKTLIELEGNTLFNYDPKNPELGQTTKADLPAGPLAWSGSKFLRDENGNYHFVYSGKDARAGKNCNAIVVEAPLDFITTSPKVNRIVNAWGESWVMKAAHKIDVPEDRRSGFARFVGWLRQPFASGSQYDAEMKNYKLVDTDAVPFADAALSERQDDRQLGANNYQLVPVFVRRFAHLGWGFGPSLTALGVPTCFDHDNSPVSVNKTYALAVEAFPRVKKCLFQELNMPDDTWNKRGLKISLKRPFEIFVPNVIAIDMDTTGTWPFGHRLEDQVATRFLSIFLDMGAVCGPKKCNIETLDDQSVWDSLPIVPKTPPNPLKNDKDFLAQFPYLAEPW